MLTLNHSVWFHEPIFQLRSGGAATANMYKGVENNRKRQKDPCFRMSFALSYYPDQGFFYFQIRSSKCID
jgi:hypothetical protein